MTLGQTFLIWENSPPLWTVWLVYNMKKIIGVYTQKHVYSINLFCLLSKVSCVCMEKYVFFYLFTWVSLMLTESRRRSVDLKITCITTYLISRGIINLSWNGRINNRHEMQGENIYGGGWELGSNPIRHVPYITPL